MEKNYKITLAYDGTRYHGWEKKKNLETIQGKLEAVLTRLCAQEIQVDGAGRTDAGVHAKGMVCSVKLDTAQSTEQLCAAMNRYLPDDIAVLEVKEAAPRFHARLKAVGKTYCYTCYIGAAKPVFDRRFVTVLERQPDCNAMRQAAEYLLGEHDFKSFCGNPKMKKSTVRTVDRLEIRHRGDYITFTVHGNGFLQHMVRILVGTLLEVGYGQRRAEEMPDLLAAQARREAGATAPAQGLCLISVDY